MTADVNSKPWRVLALRANFHLGTARILLDLVLDGPLSEPLGQQLRSLAAELGAAQEAVRSIAGVP
jgi:hypothetical protein